MQLCQELSCRPVSGFIVPIVEFCRANLECDRLQRGANPDQIHSIAEVVTIVVEMVLETGKDNMFLPDWSLACLSQLR